MDKIFNNRRNCFNSSVGKDQYVREWWDNQTTNQIIELAPAPTIPYLIYTEWNATHFEW